jgi:flavin-dependent dehydrogenase
MAKSDQYDVIIVGGSIGGCTAARLFAQCGLSVALIERSSDPAAYKKVCTHFIQPVATPILERLGLTGLIETSGGLRNRLEVWTRWGWIRDPESRGSYGYNIRRETLDPLLRALTETTEGVEFMTGRTVWRLLTDNGRIVGVETTDRNGAVVALRARLVVAADGSRSRVAELADISTRRQPNHRFTYFTYFRDLPLSTQANSHYWHLEPNLAYAFINDNQVTLLGVFLPLAQLQAWKRDVPGNFVRFWESVPDGPALVGAEQVCEMRGMIQMPNLSRPVASRGMALVGDAALTLDPMWGTGCSFAFLSAALLVDSTAEALRQATCSPRALDRGLARYRKRHRRATREHANHIASFSKIRDYRLLEALVMSAATRDADLARCMLTYIGREIGVTQLMSPANLLRAVRVNLTHAWRHKPRPTPMTKASIRRSAS